MTHPSLGLPPPSITDGHPDAARRLWALSESLTGVTYGVPAVGG